MSMRITPKWSILLNRFSYEQNFSTTLSRENTANNRKTRSFTVTFIEFALSLRLQSWIRNWKVERMCCWRRIQILIIFPLFAFPTQKEGKHTFSRRLRYKRKITWNKFVLHNTRKFAKLVTNWNI